MAAAKPPKQPKPPKTPKGKLRRNSDRSVYNVVHLKAELTGPSFDLHLKGEGLFDRVDTYVTLKLALLDLGREEEYNQIAKQIREHGTYTDGPLHICRNKLHGRTWKRPDLKNK